MKAMRQTARPAQLASPLRKLSLIDKKLLTVLLQLNGKVSHALAAKLGIPRTTVQRRRRFLEEHYLELMYVLKLNDLGYSRVDLLIYTGGGNSMKIAEALLNRDEVVNVATSIGDHTIDLRAEVVIKDNLQLLDLIEEVKAMASVKDVVWSEIVKIVGRKKSMPASIIEKL